MHKGSSELEIFEHHLRAIQLPHVISLIESFHTQSGSWAILPELRSIQNQLHLGGRQLRGKVVQLCWGLVEGLASLHEHHIAHLDIKPDNLVYDDAFQLQIVDLDVAIQVEDENEEIDIYCGTKGWTAPEVGERDGPALMYSPIKADRWICGHVILRLLDRVVEEDCRVRMVAERLKASARQQRPSLVEWRKWLASPLLNNTNALKYGWKDMPRLGPWQGTTEADGEVVKPPSAKKPRLAAPEPSSNHRFDL
jgi:serine/threonine protein kinase